MSEWKWGYEVRKSVWGLVWVAGAAVAFVVSAGVWAAGHPSAAERATMGQRAALERGEVVRVAVAPDGVVLWAVLGVNARPVYFTGRALTPSSLGLPAVHGGLGVTTSEMPTVTSTMCEVVSCW